MRLFKREPTIEFACDPKFMGVLPNPVPASQANPKWFRKMAKDTDPNGLTPGTVKRCLPFKDAMDMGYIIPLWVDLFVDNKNGSVSFSYNTRTPMKLFDNHAPSQIEGCPIGKTTYGNQPMKFINPWTITTPPGWSCMFIQPINHFDNRLHIITGVVDTDRFKTNVNFPFVWMDTEFEGHIPQGTPLVQVIPFKREDITSNISSLTQEAINKITQINTHVGTVFKNAYRLNWWSPKRYK